MFLGCLLGALQSQIVLEYVQEVKSRSMRTFLIIIVNIQITIVFSLIIQADEISQQPPMGRKRRPRRLENKRIHDNAEPNARSADSGQQGETAEACRAPVTGCQEAL